MLSVTGYWARSALGEQSQKVFTAKDVTADILPPPLYLIEARLTLSQALDGTLNATEASHRFEHLASDYEDRIGYWRKNPPFGLEKQLLGDQHRTAVAFLASARTEVLAPLLQNDQDAAKAALPNVQKLFDAHRAAVDKTVEVSQTFADDNLAHFDQVQKRTLTLVTTVFICAACACLALYAWAWRRLHMSIAKPLRHACEIAESTARGDLTPPVIIQGKDEARLMLEALATMQHGLHKIVGQVRTSSQSIAIGSTQISTGNTDLSQRTEEQASNLQETAAAMEELASTVKQNASTARSVSELAFCASGIALRGQEIVEQVVGTMKRISNSSQRVADITALVEGIAFQTNILALNAAVEAARAGEQGRGFAVVATEVRALAKRSSEAAKQISSLISESVSSIEQGSSLVTVAGGTIADIVDQVGKVNQLMSELSNATDEQHKGLAQVSSAVAVLDRVTQENAALVEQSAAAAESLMHQADKLNGVVGTFKMS